MCVGEHSGQTCTWAPATTFIIISCQRKITKLDVRTVPDPTASSSRTYQNKMTLFQRMFNLLLFLLLIDPAVIPYLQEWTSVLTLTYIRN